MLPPYPMGSGGFYEDCAAYFEHLRREGRTDYGFEDEYYFTMPAISGG